MGALAWSTVMTEGVTNCKNAVYLCVASARALRDNWLRLLYKTMEWKNTQWTKEAKGHNKLINLNTRDNIFLIFSYVPNRLLLYMGKMVKFKR